MLVNIEKTVVEGAGAAGLAAILPSRNGSRPQDRYHPVRRRPRLAFACQCAGARIGPLRAYRPPTYCGAGPAGALAAITAKFHECGVNIIEVNHHRIFTRLPAKDTVIEVECEARDSQAIETLIKRLDGAGFDVERAELD